MVDTTESMRGEHVLPEMTDDQRAAALARAHLARRTRAEIKALLKTGSLTFADVLQRATEDDLVAGTRVKAIVVSMPGMGKITTKRLLEEIGIAENRTLRGMTPRQTKELLERFS
ncbi:MAG: integration host factor, actinobacterial type [Actinomycetota bacterium]|nr:integration host factor, actinobacterial type [Actinomycetota bacterium]